MQKRIALLATGGTIASTQGKNGYAPTLGAAELIRGIRFPCDHRAAGRILFGFQQHAAGGMVRAGAGDARRAA